MKNLEILAPAGSKETFITAIEAGADAIYCGLQDFSARSKAKNFTPNEFKNYVAYAHSKNVKVYAALNTLIQQKQIKQAVKTLDYISQANADAVIVQDFGIVNIIKTYFPNLKLHASTQMAIHNSYGVLEAKKNGFKRVVLARELSLQEIKKISENSDIELEIFCHGALCFGVSGLCLMSSFIGGYSGNRGMCAQPCRRRWKFNDKEGFYLSPKDLDLSSHIKELKQSGIKSLKIEGRMKPPLYVHNTVKAYKMLAAADENNKNYKNIVNEAKELLKNDFAREKTTFNFIKKSDDIFTPNIPKQLGKYLGKIISVSDNTISLKTNASLNSTDILKCADAKNDNYFNFKILNLSKKDDIYSIATDKSNLKQGMEIFKIADGILDIKIKEMLSKTEIKINETANNTFKETLIKPPQVQKLKQKDMLYIRIDNTDWLKFLKKNADYSIIYSLTKENLGKDLSKIDFFELPAFIDEADLPLFQKTIHKLQGKSFFLNNLSHFSFFSKREYNLFAGKFLYALNSFSADFLIKNGITDFVLSIEDDFKNIIDLSKQSLTGRIIFYLSGFPELAVSNMKPHKDLQNDKIIDSAKDSFKIVHKNSKIIVLPQYPVMLFNKIKQLRKLKVNKFYADLSYITPNKTYFDTILSAYQTKIQLQNEYEFNFERSLK